jgi:hypothetical protein
MTELFCDLWDGTLGNEDLDFSSVDKSRAPMTSIEAQRKPVDVAGRQMSASVKTASKTLDLLRPLPLLPLAELTREGVKSYVDAQKELMDVMVKPNGEPKRAHKPERHAKRSPKSKAAAAAA